MKTMKTKIYYLILAVALAFSANQVNAQAKLIQFWDFNKTLPSGGAGGDSLGNVTNPLKTSYTAPSIAPDSGHIIYSRPQTMYNPTTVDGILDNGSTGSFIYDYSSSSYSYFSSSDSAGGNNFVRTRNPSDSSEMYFYIPTTGYKNISFEFALSASSSKGPNYGVFSYSTNGGGTWKKLTTVMDTFNISGTYRPDTLQLQNPVTSVSGWYPVQMNFTSDTSVNNKAGFVIRMLLAGPNSHEQTSGNARFDNFAVWGDTIGHIGAGINELSTAKASGYNVYPNPAGDFVNVLSDHYTGDKVITLYNVVGQTVSVTENHDLQTTINISSLNSGVYFVEIKEVSTGNKYTVKLVKE